VEVFCEGFDTQKNPQITPNGNRHNLWTYIAAN